MEEYVSTKIAKQLLGVTTRTLQKYDQNNEIDVIRTNGGRRRYNVKKYLKDNNKDYQIKHKKNIIYCRVSSYDRKEDLKRQEEFLKEKYKNEYDEVITDIGSGINFERNGLKKLIDYAIHNELNKVFVTYKDRLCRIGFDMINYIFKNYSNAEIIIYNHEEVSPNEEITKDLIEILTVYSSKIHGRRKNKIT